MKKSIFIILSLLSLTKVATAQYWYTFGNALSNPTTDYLGTQGAQDLNINTNGSRRMSITSQGNFYFSSPNYITHPKFSFSGSTSDILANVGSEIFTITNFVQSPSGGQKAGTYKLFKVQEITSNTGKAVPNTFLDVTSLGDVGINIDTPQAKLHVHNGLIRVSGKNGSGGPMVQFGGDPRTQSADWAIEYGFSTSKPALHGLNFWKPWGSNNPGNYFLFLADNGNVGIGTDNPGSFKLAVEGKIGAREIRVTALAQWPDYVFEDSYKKETLKEVEQYIHKNKHLPGILSAEEIKKEGGVDLGAMQVKQMEKIEELYLYVISMNKEIESLKAENTDLKKELNKLK